MPVVRLAFSQSCMILAAVVFVCCLLSFHNSEAQQKDPGDSLTSLLIAPFHFDSSLFNTDSILKKLSSMPSHELERLITKKIGIPQKDSLSKKFLSGLPRLPDKPRTILRVDGGYINYNFMYRSSVDTPFLENDLVQHLVNASVDFTLVDKVPVRFMYYGRQSNSPFFKDYGDFRIEFNAPQFRQRRQEALRKQFRQVMKQVRNPAIPRVIDELYDRSTQFSRWLNRVELINILIKCEELVVHSSELPDSTKERNPELAGAKEFIRKYYEKKKELDQAQQSIDSLTKVYVDGSKKVQQLEQVFNNNLNGPRGLSVIQSAVNDADIHDKRLDRMLRTLYAVRTFAVGRTLPNMSNLSVKNVNVNGLNFEYNAGNIYAAVSAGNIDFRVRDYVYGNQKRVPQYVYAASLGYGLKEGNHFIVTGYGGKKQIISNLNGGEASRLYGLTLESQLVIHNNIRLTAEVAQSSSPVYKSSPASNGKPQFRINDKTNKAYFVQFYSYLSRSQTRLEGTYQYAGINFQNFTNYRGNANNRSWYARIDQYLWKRQFHIIMSARKNDFSNPLIVQNYSSNTVFKTLSATFRKRHWPTISLGYTPSSQYTVIDRQVYENKYQTLTINLNHLYKFGEATFVTAFTYNRFFNKSNDSAFLYYNANNFYVYQQIMFTGYTAMIGYSRTVNAQYALDIMEAGINMNLFKQNTLGFGTKINRFGNNEVRLGFYVNGRWHVNHLGDINLWYEKGYLPGYQRLLVKNEWLTLGFIRYFKL